MKDKGYLKFGIKQKTHELSISINVRKTMKWSHYVVS